MKTADLLLLLGLFVCGSGLYLVYHPLPLIFAGAALLVLARGARMEAKK